MNPFREIFFLNQLVGTITFVFYTISSKLLTTQIYRDIVPQSACRNDFSSCLCAESALALPPPSDPLSMPNICHVHKCILTLFQHLIIVIFLNVYILVCNISYQVTLWRAVTNIVAPLFYICAAEKDKLKKVNLKHLLRLPDNNVHPVIA